MDAHPVPQNITSFQFHLIGDMTMKQFEYLAVGLTLSYITFITIGLSAPFIAWPMIIVFSLTGATFAFLPIGDRPLDHWLLSFMRAILLPTQRIWSPKQALEKSKVFKRRLNIYLSSTTPSSEQLLTAHTQPNLSVISQMAPKEVPIVSSQPTQVEKQKPTNLQEEKELPTPKELVETVDLAKKAQTIQTRIVETEHQLNTIRESAAMPGSDPKEFTEDFQRILTDLQNLSNQATTVSRELAVLSRQKTPQAAHVVVVAPKKPTQTNLVLTTTPNVINGIVTDASNNYLEGVIVVTHNAEGLPVRALKTNKLGQFVAATPLPNGKYTISLEKDNLSFDNLQIELDGNAISPIAISAKKGGA